MADTDPAATLHALADHFRKYDEVTTLGGVIAPEFRALAEHVEGVAQRHFAVKVDLTDGEQCDRCTGWGEEQYALEPYPCPEVRELLAVAATAGITP